MQINRNTLLLLMMERGLSNKELAEQAGISPATVSTLRSHGTGRLESIRKVSDALGVEPRELVKE